MNLTFPLQLDRVRDGMLAQADRLRDVAHVFADAIAAGGLVHVYANGHSRIATEELIVRLGALTGFHPLLAPGLATFDAVVGARGIRVNQRIESVEGLGETILAEFDFAAHDVLMVISATGTTPAAVDAARAFVRRYPDNPLVVLASAAQAREARPKHSSGQTLHHVVEEAGRAYFIDNCMPIGDLSLTIEGQHATYQACPLSSIGALTAVHSLNELTLRELDARGIRHHVLQNMHLHDTTASYDAWLRDQRRRYAGALHAGSGMVRADEPGG